MTGRIRVSTLAFTSNLTGLLPADIAREFAQRNIFSVRLRALACNSSVSCSSSCSIRFFVVTLRTITRHSSCTATDKTPFKVCMTTLGEVKCIFQ